MARSLLTSFRDFTGWSRRSMVEEAAAYIHVDVMDCHFVPNLTSPLVLSGAAATQLPTTCTEDETGSVHGEFAKAVQFLSFTPKRPIPASDGCALRPCWVQRALCSSGSSAGMIEDVLDEVY